MLLILTRPHFFSHFFFFFFISFSFSLLCASTLLPVLVGVEALTRRARLRTKSGIYSPASPTAVGDTDVRAEVERYEGTEADVYSVGATLFVLIFGEAPFTDCDGIDGLISAKYEPPRMPNAAFENSPQLRDLLLRFMAPLPSSRITIEGAMQVRALFLLSLHLPLTRFSQTKSTKNWSS